MTPVIVIGLNVAQAMLEQIVAHGVVIKGGADDDAVLCTKSKTYAIKQAETSNTLLLIPGRQVGETALRREAHAAPVLPWLPRATGALVPALTCAARSPLDRKKRPEASPAGEKRKASSSLDEVGAQRASPLSIAASLRILLQCASRNALSNGPGRLPPGRSKPSPGPLLPLTAALLPAPPSRLSGTHSRRTRAGPPDAARLPRRDGLRRARRRHVLRRLPLRARGGAPPCVAWRSFSQQRRCFPVPVCTAARKCWDVASDPPRHRRTPADRPADGEDRDHAAPARVLPAGRGALRDDVVCLRLC